MSLFITILRPRLRLRLLAKLISGTRLLRQKLTLWQQNSRGRRQLAEFSDAQLKDIGITPCQRREEIRKHFWQ